MVTLAFVLGIAVGALIAIPLVSKRLEADHKEALDAKWKAGRDWAWANWHMSVGSTGYAPPPQTADVTHIVTEAKPSPLPRPKRKRPKAKTPNKKGGK